MDAPVNAAVQQSIDEGDNDGWVAGEVFEVTSVKQVSDLALTHSSRKVILMCKSKVWFAYVMVHGSTHVRHETIAGQNCQKQAPEIGFLAIECMCANPG